jgi:hypothetical protein
MSLLNLQNYTKVMQDFISKSQGNKNTEFEIRFGSYNFNKETKKSNFVSSVEIDFFYDLKRSFLNQKFQSVQTNTEETIYSDGRQNIKKIVNVDTKSKTIHYMVKSNIKKFDVYDYDFRLSLASERIVSDKAIDFDKLDVITKRNKQRTSFILPFGSLDLTIVNQDNQQNKYEIELESKNGSYEQVLEYLTVLLQIRQNNFFVISNTEKRNVVKEYKELVQSHYFIGAQPETLQKQHIPQLYKTLYSVTDKADGDRMLLFITKDKIVYFIDNNLQKLYKTDITSNSYFSCILDGEVVRYNNKISYLAFDLIAYNSKDLRGDTNYLLKTRLNRMNDIVKALSLSNMYIVQSKKFYIKNVFLGSEKIMNTLSEFPYKNDGLIYTPMNEPYPTNKKWSSLLKWKPGHLNSIDFFAIKDSHTENGNSIWKLYVQHIEQNQQSNNRNLSKVLFDVDKLCENTVSDNVTFQTSFSDSLLDPTTNEPYQSNTVIEFAWNPNIKQFVPLRTRWDKTNNPKKHGNFSSVACDIWYNINNPVEMEMLFKFTTFSKSKEDFFFENLRKFHNKIKEYLYNKYTNNCEYLLELCSGKGGDMHKWLYNNIKNIVGYDISSKHIDECIKRINNSNFNPSINSYNFHQLDLCSSQAPHVISSNNPDKFNVICCHFGVHYFFQSKDSFQNLIDIIRMNLLNNGIFIVTFMDLSKVNVLLKESVFESVVYAERENEIVYYIKKNTSTWDNKYGNELRIVLNGNNILSQGSNEYTIDFEWFTNELELHNIKLIDTYLFSEYKHFAPNLHSYANDLSPEEKDISFLNRYAVFQYIEKQELSLPYQESFDICKSEPFTVTDLHRYNLSVQKISDTYELVDLLNCIEYQYNKLSIENCIISSFEDIQRTFELLNTSYIPMYIDDPFDIKQYNSNSLSTFHFTFHNHIVEKQTDGDIEKKEFDNWYIILHNGLLLFNNISTSNIQSDIQSNIQSDLDTQITDTENSTNEQIIDYLQKNKNKTTIKELQCHLKTLGLKTSGKKEELLKRLTLALNI